MTIDPDYSAKGVANPYYTVDSTIETLVGNFLPKTIKSKDILFKSVRKSKGKTIYESKRAAYQFQLVNKITNVELPYNVLLTKSEVKGHYGTASAGQKVTVKTAWQERGAAYIFEQALVNNVDYSKKLKSAMVKLKTNPVVLTKKVLSEDLLLEVFKDDLSELRKIFEVKGSFGFPYHDWLNSFYFSQKVLLEKYSNTTFQRFERDGGFMEFITKLIKTKFGISQKDTWNPADVWAVKGTPEAVEKYVNDKMKDIIDYDKLSKKYQGAQLEQHLRAGILYLNSVLIDLLTGKNPKVVGISLKLTDSGAHIEEVNFDKVKENIKENKALIDTVADPFKIDPKEDFVCNFALTSGKSARGTFTQDVRIFAEDLHSGSIYNFQIKANSSESANGSNLKFELTIQGKGAARGGKVPVDLIVSLINKIQRNAFVNDYNKFPRTNKEFVDNLTKGKNYKAMFEKVKNNVKDIGVDYKQFVINVSDSLSKGGPIATNATCKLMGFEFINFLLSIDEKQMRGLITDMSFLAQKKNIRSYDTFGPFIKIS